MIRQSEKTDHPVNFKIPDSLMEDIKEALVAIPETNMSELLRASIENGLPSLVKNPRLIKVLDRGEEISTK